MNNKDYKLKKQNESTWLVVDTSNNNVVDTITKEMIVERCEMKDINVDIINVDDFTFLVWSYFCDNNKELVRATDIYYIECDKFFAWFDYICTEYMTTKILSWYKERYQNTNNIKA